MSICAFSLAVNDSSPWKDDVGVAVLTTGMSAQTLIGACRTLARIRAPEDADEFDKLADNMRKTFAQRDLFAHCIWKPGKKRGTVIPELAKTIGSMRKTQDRAYTAAEITKTQEIAGEHMMNLLGFLVRWGIAPMP